MRFAFSTAGQVRSCSRNCRRQVLLQDATGLLRSSGLGRWRKATTREPGDLPERSHPSGARDARSGRTSAVVTEGAVTRTEAA